jgi:hypothetical protein
MTIALRSLCSATVDMGSDCGEAGAEGRRASSVDWRSALAPKPRSCGSRQCQDEACRYEHFPPLVGTDVMSRAPIISVRARRLSTGNWRSTLLSRVGVTLKAFGGRDDQWPAAGAGGRPRSLSLLGDCR